MRTPAASASTSAALLTPTMAALLRSIARTGRPPFHAMGVAEARRTYLAAAEVLDLPRVALDRVEDLRVLVAAGVTLAARLYAPSHDALPALLYFHGGGFTIGGIETHESLCRQIAHRSGAAVIAFDYRLAPEHRFPIAVDDCWAALRWLATEGRSLRLDTSRLAVGGDSAGGTLAAVCALRARDHTLPLRLQVLITPGAAAHADTASHADFAKGFLLEADDIEWFFMNYIDPSDRADWRFAPMLADDLEGVAPACVVLAECDALVDEGIAYADRLRAAGVAVELELYRGVTHDFIKMGRVLAEARAAQAAIGAALQQAFTT